MTRAEELAAESGREKARERLKQHPPTIEQLRLVRALLRPADPRRPRSRE